MNLSILNSTPPPHRKNPIGMNDKKDGLIGRPSSKVRRSQSSITLDAVLFNLQF